MDETYKEIFASSYPDDLEGIVELLGSHSIPFKIHAAGTEFNPNFNFAHSSSAISVLVEASAYDAAYQLLVDEGLIGGISASDGYRQMLSDLDDRELEEMVINSIAYPEEQSKMAATLLSERGVQLENKEIEAKRTEFATEQRKPMQIGMLGKTLWVLLSVAIPPAGFFISIVVLLLKGRDANGQSFPFYGKPTKVLAWVLLSISSLIMLFYIYLNYKTYRFMAEWY